MKKVILFVLILLLSRLSYGQWPITQNLASDSSLVNIGRTPAGGIKGNIILVSYADTTAANLTRVKYYAGAVIYTISGNKLWVRNSTATGWVEQGSSSSVNIYNSDGTLSGTRVLDLSTYPLAFSRSSVKQFAAEDNLTTIGSPNNLRRFTIYNDSIVLIMGSDQSASSSDSVLVRTVDGRIKTRAQSQIGGSIPTLPQVLTAGSALDGNYDIDLDGHDLTFIDNSSTGTFAVNMQGPGAIGFTVTNSGDASSSLTLTHDTAFLYLHKGLLVMDTVFRASNLTNKLVAVWDSSSRILQFINPDSLGTGGSSDSSQIIIDTTYNRIGVVVSTDTSLFKSLRIQVNSGTITPTVTDSTISWDLTSLTTSLTNGLTLTSGVGKLGGALTEATNITNASGHTFKLHLDEDDEDVGFIGDTYNSLIGFQNGNLVLSQNSGSTVVSVTSTYSSLQAASGGYSTDFLVYRNKVQINPHLGALYVDTLTNAVGTKALRYNPTTGLVTYADTTTGGSSSPAGNYGNVQVNRNGAFDTPASDSLDFDAGLVVKGSLKSSTLTSGRVPFIGTAGLIQDDAKLTFSAGSYPSLTIGATGGVTSSLALRDAAGTFGYVTSETGLSLYGSTTYTATWFYPSVSHTTKPFLRLYYNLGPKSASFYKTVVTVDTLVGGSSDGAFHATGTLGDSTSTATTNNGHSFRSDVKMFGNGASVNTFYSSIHMANTNSGATQGHLAHFQSDSRKTGDNTVDIFYHGAFLADQILDGIVNKRYGIKYWDAHVNTGAALGSQMAFKTDKLKAASGLNFHFLADSSHYAQLDGNMLLGDSAVATSARKTLHIFDGTAPASNISGVIIYSESGEAKVRDGAGNITTFSPHNFTKLGKPSEKLAWSYYSEKDGEYITVDMAKAIRTIEEQQREIEELKQTVYKGYKKKQPIELIKKGRL